MVPCIASPQTCPDLIQPCSTMLHQFRAKRPSCHLKMAILGHSGPYLGPLTPSGGHSWPMNGSITSRWVCPDLLHPFPHLWQQNGHFGPSWTTYWKKSPQTLKNCTPYLKIGKFVYICRLDGLQAQNIICIIFSHKIPILPVTRRKLGEKGQNPQYWKTHTNIRKFRSGLWPERLTTLKQRKNGLGFYEIPFLPGTGRKGPKNAWLLPAQFFLSFLMRK